MGILTYEERKRQICRETPIPDRHLSGPSADRELSAAEGIVLKKTMKST